MADSVALGDLFVRISGNVEGLVQSSKQANQALESMNVGGNRLVSGMTMTTGLVAGAFLVMARSVVGALDGIIEKFVDTGKTAQQLGMTVEELSKLQFAARKAGISSNELTSAIKDFAKQAGEVRSGLEPMDNFQLALARIGISFNDLQSRKPTDLLLEISDRFSRMDDGVRKTRASLDMFGKSGSEIISFLNQGPAAIRAYMKEVEDLGDVLSKDTAMKALQFKRSIDQIYDSFEVVTRQVVISFLPAMQQVADHAANATKNTEGLRLAADGLKIVFNALLSGGYFVAGVFRALAEELGAFGNLIQGLWGGKIRQSLEEYSKATSQAKENFRGTFTAIGDLWKASGVAAGGWATSVSVATEEVTKDFKQLEITARQAAERQAEARRLFVEGLTLTPGPTVSAIQAIEAAMKAGRLTITEYRQAMDQALGNERRFQLLQLDDVMTKTSASMQEKMEALRTALRNGSISWSQYGRNVREVEEQNRNNMLDTATMAASTISSVFKNNKGASIASALINTAVGITKALAQGGIWGWAQAGLIAAAGAAQVAAISSTNEDGTGGGVANPASSAATAQEAPAENRTLFVQGFNKNEFFDGETTANIARNLVQYQRDGGMVVIK